jgi:hypothetical protein
MPPKNKQKFEQKKTKTLPLKNIPSDVHKTIKQEQLRLELHDDTSLTVEGTVYRMIREWRQLKNEKATTV